MNHQFEHWFNRLWGIARRDVYLLQTPTGWQILVVAKAASAVAR